MKYEFFTVPVCSFAEAQQRLNNFCTRHRVASVDKHFVADGQNSFWAFCVIFIEEEQKHVPLRKNKIDYREVLNEKDFAIYAKLRSLRKELSEKEGVPAYALFTNEQLATMIRRSVHTATAMMAIEGIGKGRMEKYGEFFLCVLKKEDEILQRTTNETN